jgi:ABC-2 type transport system permease protein
VTLWRLEFARLFRSPRWLILLVVFGFFGLLGPLTARYLPWIVESVEGTTAGLPEFGPPDGIVQYIGNAQQLGILAVVFVASAALAIDANIELSVFFRTRAAMRDIITPRFVVSAAAASVAFVFGTVIAYVGTGILLDWIDVGPLVVGVLLQCVYLTFAVAVVASVASVVRKLVAVALVSVGVLILLAVLSLLSPVAPWLPSDLISALEGLIRGGEFEYWRSLGVTAALTVVLLVIAIRRLESREI